MTSTIIIFLLALLGVGESVYLFSTRRRGTSPVCIIGNECHTVLEDRHNKTFGIQNDLLGIIFYTISSFVALGIIFRVSLFIPLGDIQTILVAGGTVMASYYLYLQWRVIQAWCFWCTMSAINVWVMAAVLAITHFQ